MGREEWTWTTFLALYFRYNFFPFLFFFSNKNRGKLIANSLNSQLTHTDLFRLFSFVFLLHHSALSLLLSIFPSNSFLRAVHITILILYRSLIGLPLDVIFSFVCLFIVNVFGLAFGDQNYILAIVLFKMKMKRKKNCVVNFFFYFDYYYCLVGVMVLFLQIHIACADKITLVCSFELFCLCDSATVLFLY